MPAHFARLGTGDSVVAGVSRLSPGRPDRRAGRARGRRANGKRNERRRPDEVAPGLSRRRREALRERGAYVWRRPGVWTPRRCFKATRRTRALTPRGAGLSLVEGSGRGEVHGGGAGPGRLGSPPPLPCPLLEGTRRRGGAGAGGRAGAAEERAAPGGRASGSTTACGVGALERRKARGLARGGFERRFYRRGLDRTARGCTGERAARVGYPSLLRRARLGARGARRWKPNLPPPPSPLPSPCLPHGPLVGFPWRSEFSRRRLHRDSCFLNCEPEVSTGPHRDLLGRKWNGIGWPRRASRLDLRGPALPSPTDFSPHWSGCGLGSACMALWGVGVSRHGKG